MESVTAVAPNARLPPAVNQSYEEVSSSNKEKPLSNEIRVASNGNIGRFVHYALDFFKEGCREVKFRGTGSAMVFTVQIAEIVKRKQPGLHQITSIEYHGPTDANTENAFYTDKRRNTGFLKIVLSLDPLDEKDMGYQPPLDPSFLVTDPVKSQILDSTGRCKIWVNMRNRGARNYNRRRDDGNMSAHNTSGNRQNDTRPNTRRGLRRGHGGNIRSRGEHSKR